MIIKDEKYDKFLEMFNNLKKYVGNEVKVIVHNQKHIQYYLGVLKRVNSFDSIILDDDTILEFFTDNSLIYEISFGGELLYRNMNEDKIYHNSKEKVWGITDNIVKIYKYNKLFASKNSDNIKYEIELAGINLVKEEKQKEWLCFVENYFDCSVDIELMNLVIELLKMIRKRISYEVIYNYLISDDRVFYGGEFAIALDIITNFTDTGKFLREYIVSRIKGNGLNLTLQK